MIISTYIFVAIPVISNSGPGTTFQDPIAVVQVYFSFHCAHSCLIMTQATVDHIKVTENITRIIAMTHIGYEKDIELAQNTRVGAFHLTLRHSIDPSSCRVFISS